MDPQPINNEQQGIDNNNPNNAQPEEDITTNLGAFSARYHIYRPHRVMGKGAFGKVYRARDMRGEGTDVAIKEFRNRNAYHLHSFIQELTILVRIGRHNDNEGRVNNFTVPLLDFHHNPQTLKRSYLVLGLMGETLGDEVERRANSPQRFLLDKICSFGLQIASGLQFLEGLNIIHADLKPKNIIFTDANCEHLRIIDFGHSFERGNGIQHHLQTPAYRAMEMFLELGSYTNAIDIWSFGCILAFMSCATGLFLASRYGGDKKFVHQIVRTLGMPPPGMLTTDVCYRYFKQRRNGQWVKKQSLCERIFEPRSLNIRQFLHRHKQQTQSDESQEYEWFVQLIEQTLVYDVNTRINIANIIGHNFFRYPPAPRQP